MRPTTADACRDGAVYPDDCGRIPAGTEVCGEAESVSMASA